MGLITRERRREGWREGGPREHSAAPRSSSTCREEEGGRTSRESHLPRTARPVLQHMSGEGLPKAPHTTVGPPGKAGPQDPARQGPN